jgi:mono/diheme cytochrome c family protein
MPVRFSSPFRQESEVSRKEKRNMNTIHAGMAMLLTMLVLCPVIGDATDRRTPTAPDEFVKMTNPVAQSAATLKEAATVYDNKCSKCHGSNGDGRGSATKDLDVKPRNYTDKALMEKIPDGQLFWIICYGSDPDTTEMKGYKKKLSEEQMWSLVHYIRAFAR